MYIRSDSRVPFSRPKDTSLEAYKAWVVELASKLTTKKQTPPLTEQEWKESWKEYWQQKSRK